MKNKLWLVALLLSFVSPSYGTAYKWVDEQGNTQYSQTPPDNAAATAVAPPPPPPASAAQEINNAKALEQKQMTAEEKQQLASQKAAQEAQIAKEKAVNCQKAKTHLDEVQSKVRVRLFDAQGNQQLLTPDERDAEIAKTKANIEKFCNQ